MASNLQHIYTELFRRGDFDFITRQGDVRHEKQQKALEILTDNETKEFGYGGAAGGSKSWTGCTWEAFMCLAYPETRYFIGREELKRLRESTFQTFLKICKAYSITDWKYNGQDHFIQFENGSRIDLLDLKYLPSDPLYERYGSTEYTGGWIEEGGEVNFGAYDTLKSRVGRHNNERYGITGKILTTLNPKKNWCNTLFWKPFRAGELHKGMQFLQALVTDNPYIDKGYIEQLKSITDKVKKQRLLYGNFDYDDDDNSLIDYDSIRDLFTNTFVPGGEKYITADVARFGADKSVIMVWDGFRVIEILTLKHKKTTEVAEAVRQLQRNHKVANSHTIADSDGVGGGVVDELNCKSFVNNATPLKHPKRRVDDNYKNLKSQCYFYLAMKVTAKEIFVNCHDPALQEVISEELEQVKRKDPDKDGKLSVVPKDEVKELLGRSPDYSDTLMMRMYFELQQRLTWVVLP